MTLTLIYHKRRNLDYSLQLLCLRLRHRVFRYAQHVITLHVNRPRYAVLDHVEAVAPL